VLGCAQTGTGKTAGFTLPMIDILAAGRARARMPRSLILEPTRELAAQVSNAFETYGKHHKLSMALLIGGESFSDQERKLDRGVDVLIATPGRLIDLFERGKILLSDVKILVIDEADRMLDMGFIPDVERIVGLLPRIRQTLFFSATMPPEIRRLADAFLMNPKEISVAPPASPAALVTQHLITVEPDDKREALRRLIRSEDVKNAIIFCNRKRDVDILHRSLAKHGFDAAPLHGDMAQARRTETLDRFRNGEIAILVASDVAARGLDIEGLSHVFNFDVPIHAEDYVHRIGRTGRAGREGHAFTLASENDGRFVEAIEKLIGKAIPRIEILGIPTVGFEEKDARRGRRGEASESRRRGEASESRRRGEASESRRRSSDRPRASEKKHSGERPAPEMSAAIDPMPAKKPAAPQTEEKPVSHPTRHAPVRSGDRRSGDRRSRQPREQEGDQDAPVLAFGDHMPEFLKRPVKLPPLRKEEPEAA
jgi:superfamily II DNA/RNA helicase